MKLDRVIAVRNDKTVYRDGDACVKVFNDDYSKADVLNEALNQTRIEETNLNIPKLREVTMLDGKWVIVSDYIKGKTLSQLMKQDTENIYKYIEMLVDVQLEIHKISSPLLKRLKDKLNVRISQTELDATVRFDLHIRVENMPKLNKLCHGDIVPSNIIISDEGKAYIVDWAHATQGNIYADVARTYLHFRLRENDEVADKYLEIYCCKSNAEAKEIKKWIPIVAAALSVKEHIDERREKLLSWVKVR